MTDDTSPPDELRGALDRSDGVVLTADGRLRARTLAMSKSGGTPYHDKRETLALKRKRLVYGLDGHDPHSLAEANRIVAEEWDAFVAERRGPLARLLGWLSDRLP